MTPGGLTRLLCAGFFIVVYFTIPSESQTIQRQIMVLLVNNELGGMWKETIKAKLRYSSDICQEKMRKALGLAMSCRDRNQARERV
jgi:hypothetical protein